MNKHDNNNSKKKKKKKKRKKMKCTENSWYIVLSSYSVLVHRSHNRNFKKNL